MRPFMGRDERQSQASGGGVPDYYRILPRLVTWHLLLGERERVHSTGRGNHAGLCTGMQIQTGAFRILCRRFASAKSQSPGWTVGSAKPVASDKALRVPWCMLLWG